MPLDSAVARAGSLRSTHFVKLAPVPLHRFSSFGATPPPSASGIKSQSMLPDASRRNIRLGFTVAVPDLVKGDGAISVKAALAGCVANPITIIIAALAKIGFFGEVRFMITPVQW